MLENLQIGTSISDVVLAFQHRGGEALLESKADMATLIRQAVEELYRLELIDEKDKLELLDGFAEALDVLANKRDPSEAFTTSRNRLANTISNCRSSQVASALAELCHSVVADQLAKSVDKAESVVFAAQASTTITGKGEQALFWGAVGAAIGGSIGGVGGALVGGAVGAAVGACGDSGTTITVTNNGSS